MAYTIAVMGSGGVGGYFGGRLAQAGVDVTFIARGAHLDAMKRNGLKIESPNGDCLIQPAQCVASPAEIERADAILFTVKMGDTETAAASLKPLVANGATIFTFQNGVESMERIGAIVGINNVVPGSVGIPASIKAPGVIAHAAPFARMTFGEADGRPSARTHAFLEVCKRAAFDTVLSDDINRAVWLKFAMLAPHSGLTSLTRGPIGPIRDHAGSRRLLEAAVREVVAVGIAGKKGLVAADEAATLKIIDALPHGMMSSMCHDLLAGKPLELPGLSGAVAAMGERLGIATPTHRFIADALSVHQAGKASAGQ